MALDYDGIKERIALGYVPMDNDRPYSAYTLMETDLEACLEEIDRLRAALKGNA